MNSLRAVEAELPPGFRFQPRDDELICDYLMKQAAGCISSHTPFLIQLDLNSCEPWDIPEVACVGGKAWYFYSQRDKKYATGLRTNRATVSGYWKATGKDRPVAHEGILVGMRKTLVFYQGRAPKGAKTAWVMHEFRLEMKFGPGPLVVTHVQDEFFQRAYVLTHTHSKKLYRGMRARGLGFMQSVPEEHAASTQTTHRPSNLSSAINGTLQQADPFPANYYHKHHEHVPCFSCFNRNPCQSLLLTQPDQQILPTNVTPNSAGLTTHNLGGISYHKSDPYFDENVIQAVSGHFTKMESFDNDSCVEGSSCFGDKELSESYLPRSELDSIWN